ncbi:TetR/AcrR family transcriptional regulator [Streptomyces sp. NPDC017979]|uniref:TetR/AcrR family transcriptional regulator n=1 Tax=Streptomyces sp. NPDC017979 TaxID=3365024 RepID=UPI0037AC1E0C
MTDAPRPRTRRPRDRKQQIVAAAAEQFRKSGYHQVAMTDIAEAVGITGPALYRHFRSKQDLLFATLLDVVEEGILPDRASYGDLPGTLDVVVATMLDRRHARLLWERELRHLPPERRHELMGRHAAKVRPLRDAIAAARPELPSDEVDLLLWAALGALVGVNYQAVKAEPAQIRSLMVAAALAVCRAEGLPLAGAVAGPELPVPRGRLTPASRREAVLAASIRLFAERGYQNVGMDDIGLEAAGLAASSLYHHFPSKSAILVAVLTRCLEAMLFDLSAALGSTDDPARALDMALRSFVRINAVHGDAMSALVIEMVSVPPEDREVVRRMQRDYVTEWAALLTRHRPELSPQEAELLALTAQTVVNSLRRVSGLSIRPVSQGELVVIGRAVLGLTPPDKRTSPIAG